ncbi:unnamed protein product [Lampetra planeri]
MDKECGGVIHQWTMPALCAAGKAGFGFIAEFRGFTRKILAEWPGLESQGQDQHGLSPGRGQDRERRGARRGLRLDDTEASSARHLRGFDLLHGAVSGGVRAVNERDASGSATASPVPEQGHHHHADHRAEQDHHHHAAHRAGTPQSRTRAGPSSPRCPAGRDPAGQRQEGASDTVALALLVRRRGAEGRVRWFASPHMFDEPAARLIADAAPRCDPYARNGTSAPTTSVCDPPTLAATSAVPDDRSRVASRPPPLRVSGALIGGARQQPRGRCRDGARRRVEATGLTLSRRGDTPRHRNEELPPLALQGFKQEVNSSLLDAQLSTRRCLCERDEHCRHAEDAFYRSPARLATLRRRQIADSWRIKGTGRMTPGTDLDVEPELRATRGASQQTRPRSARCW